MNTETIIVNENTFKTVVSAVNQMVDLIKPTYGPASNKIIIDKITHRMVIDDGVQGARDFELPDTAENAVVKVIREAAIKTNDIAKDGTTGALIMVQAIIQEVSRKRGFNGRKIELELKKAVEEVKKELTKNSKQISTKEELKKVSMSSFDNEKIADIVSELTLKVGKDGVITLDNSPTMETVFEMTDGIKLKSGYISPYMVTNQERMETIIEKPYILLTDYRLTEAKDIVGLLEKLAEEKIREIVIIAENVEQNALATAIVNKVQGKFLTLTVAIPKITNKTGFMEDLALLTGGTVFTENKGNKLENATVKDLGRAERFICKQSESIIIGPKGKKADITTAINSYKIALKNETVESKRKEIEERLQRFQNNVAVIKVGAPTDNERKALRYKVEDAINSTKLAYNDGVVCGSGLALARIKTSSEILNSALKYPLIQLYDNMGIELSKTLIDSKEAFNVVTEESGNFLDVGVVDPVKTLIAGVESAVSIASQLITSSGMIVVGEVKDNKEN